MPGHMNVLLAGANVPYPQLKEMDEVNPEFARADVALVVGANDVVNPAARRPGNVISGMPILDVDKAHSVIVIKRSMGHGYAGIDNELYSDPSTDMLFADAKAGLARIAAAAKVLVGARWPGTSPTAPGRAALAADVSRCRLVSASPHDRGRRLVARLLTGPAPEHRHVQARLTRGCRCAGRSAAR
jgi:hypothetical protein